MIISAGQLASRLRFLAVAVVVCLWGGRPVQAHEGPPFPVMMEKPVPGYLISVWADPDIGTGRFIVRVESPDRKSTPTTPKVRVWVEPVSKRLPKVIYPAEQQSLRSSLQFLAEPEFDKQDQFTVGIVIESPSGEVNELLTQVKATPPGLGPIGFLLYLTPFVAFGGIWCFAMVRRWKGGGARYRPVPRPGQVNSNTTAADSVPEESPSPDDASTAKSTTMRGKERHNSSRK